MDGYGLLIVAIAIVATAVTMWCFEWRRLDERRRIDRLDELEGWRQILGTDA